MKSSKLTLQCFIMVVASIPLILVGYVFATSFQAKPAKDKPPADGVKPAINNPLLETLLASKTDGDFYQSSDFFCTLAALMSDNNIMVDRMLYDGMLYDDSGEGTQTGRATALLVKGRAVTVTSEERTFVVAILGAGSFSIPGVEAQKLILIDDTGKILDELSCGINTRYGSLLTGYPKRDEDDGAKIVIRFTPRTDKSTWHNWHTVTHGENTYTFRSREKGDPIDWLGRGLVRVAIKNRKFRILFPEVNEPENKDPKK